MKGRARERTLATEIISIVREGEEGEEGEERERLREREEGSEREEETKMKKEKREREFTGERGRAHKVSEYYKNYIFGN